MPRRRQDPWARHLAVSEEPGAHQCGVRPNFATTIGARPTMSVRRINECRQPDWELRPIRVVGRIVPNGTQRMFALACLETILGHFTHQG